MNVDGEMFAPNGSERDPGLLMETGGSFNYTLRRQRCDALFALVCGYWRTVSPQPTSHDALNFATLQEWIDFRIRGHSDRTLVD